jgi:sulfur carrier protein ThiS
MTITVKMVGPLIYAVGFSEQDFELPSGSTVAELLQRIDLVSARPKIVTRNGQAVDEGDPLADGDRVVVSPIYSGG